MEQEQDQYDVVVVGAGNAAFSAAHAAREDVLKVCVLEKAPASELGGNSYFTLGSFRTTYRGLDDLLPLLADPAAERTEDLEAPPYTEEHFLADMRRLTRGRTDPQLSSMLVDRSYETVRWLQRVGIKWKLQSDNQTYVVDGKRRFWGGGTLATVGGGKGLVQQHLDAARASGIDVRTNHPMVALERGPGGAVTGVVCDTPEGRTVVRGRSVVLACGGFEANARMRAAYLGRNWDTVRVRGTRHNTGDGLNIAVDNGAQPFGHWSGAHAVQWDPAAPIFGDRVLTNQLQRHSYPFGILVNVNGRRFVDEASDFRNYTYAKLGAEVLDQPGGMAFQIFDQESKSMLRTDYGHEGATVHEADSIAELAERLSIDADALQRTVDEYNAATRPGQFDPTVLDGLATVGIEPPKSNWARAISKPPFIAYPVMCAITFTYGGVRIDEDARVLDQSDTPIPGLHAAGEMVGGLFYDNYPGGSGLMSGAVFGYQAGKTAAKHARAGD